MTDRPDRPAAALAMGPEVAELVLPEALRERLGEHVRLAPGLVNARPDHTSPDVLADAEILVSGWGCPRLTADVLARAPRLRAVMHAAGSVKSLVSDALWERGVVVSRAPSWRATADSYRTKHPGTASTSTRWRRAATRFRSRASTTGGRCCAIRTGVWGGPDRG
ncbi:hypothetical protein ACGFR8_21300 [Streptomyces brevispora]|uniref:hypothetical protein n=1 Tax=Streptomyces brevispora TaxID=887462 RepID=UPI003723BB28